MTSIVAPDITNALTALGKTTTAAATNAIKHKTPNNVKALQTSRDFEAVFLHEMFQQMFSGIKSDGPLGGDGTVGIWRSFLTDEYAKTFARAGGIGIGDQVYRTLMQIQEARTKPAS